MKISRTRIKEIVRETIVEENEYQTFFQKCLEKAGKSIPNMGEQEKKDFFNKIDSAWQSRGEKRGKVKEKVLPTKSSPVFEAKPIEISTAKHIASVGDYGNDYMTVFKKAKDNKIRKYLATIGEKGFRELLYRNDLEKYIFGESVNEAKLYSVNPHPIGKAKYSIDWYDGKSKNKDGSPQIGIYTFKNRKSFEDKMRLLKNLKWKEVNDVFNSLKQENVNETLVTYKVVDEKGKDVDTNLPRHMAIALANKKKGWKFQAEQGDFAPKESVREGVITYGVKYKSTPKDKTWKKASVTMTTHNPDAHKDMVKAIKKQANGLKTQEKWHAVQITKDGSAINEDYDPKKADFLNKAVKTPNIVGATKGNKHNTGWKFEFKDFASVKQAKKKMIDNGTNINSITTGQEDGNHFIEVFYR